MCALRGFPFVPLPCPPLPCPHGSLYLIYRIHNLLTPDSQKPFHLTLSHPFLSMSVLAPAPSPAPSPAAVLAHIILVFCLRGSMPIFVEWCSEKTIKLDVAACYTIDTVEAMVLAQEGTPRRTMAHLVRSEIGRRARVGRVQHQGPVDAAHGRENIKESQQEAEALESPLFSL